MLYRMYFMSISDLQDLNVKCNNSHGFDTETVSVI